MRTQYRSFAVVMLAVLASPVDLLATRALAETVIDAWASVQAPPAPALKPVTIAPKTTALLLLDFLPGGYCGGKPRCVASLPAVKALLAAARAAGAPVIYSVAGDFSPADILKEVAPNGNEPWVRSAADKFLNTDLDKILKEKGVQTVIVTGTAAHGAVLYTGGGAGLRGYRVIVPVDCLSDNDLYAEQVTVWQLANGPRFGPLVTLTRSDMIKF